MDLNGIKSVKDSPNLRVHLKVRCLGSGGTWYGVRSLCDTGNTLREPAAISEAFHSKLGVGLAVKRRVKCGTAKAGTHLTKLGITNPFVLHIPGVRRMTIQPTVVRGLSDDLNLGSAFFHRLGLEKPTVIKFSGGKTTLEVGHDGKAEMIQRMDERGRPKRGVERKEKRREKSTPRRLPQVRAIRDYRCPARTLTFVPVEISGREPGTETYIAPTPVGGQGGDLVRPAVVGAAYTVQSTENSIAVLNDTDKDTWVKAGDFLAHSEKLRTNDMGTQEVEPVDKNLTDDQIKAHKAQIWSDLNLEENKILKEHPEAMKRVRKIIDRYWSVFGEPNITTGLTDLAEFKIKLKPDAVPHRAKVRPLNPAQMESLKEQMALWLEEGVIEPSESPWAAALVPAKKKGGLIRWAIDYRQLNSWTVPDSFPLPNIEQNLEKLSGGRIFSALDAAAAYNTIPVSEESKHLLAFITPMGLYTYSRMPFGPKNSGAVYARFVESLLSKLRSDQVIAYLDDILVFTADVMSHVDQLEKVLELHRHAGIKLRPKKTHLFQESSDYLGFHVGKDGIHMQEGYVERILQWPQPQDTKQLNSWLGFVGYYRSFIPEFAALTKEMNAQRKEKVLKWTENMTADFEKLKEKFKERPIRSYPRYDLDEPFQLTTDFSSKAIGGVLSQVQNGKERMIAAVARKCTKHEENYASVKGELSALVYCCRKFEHILRYRPFVVNTDSQALKHLRNLKTPTGIWFRWCEELSSYDFEVRHRPGKENVNADALSRATHHPDPTPEEVKEQEEEFMKAIQDLGRSSWHRKVAQVDANEEDAERHQIAEGLLREQLKASQKADAVLKEVRKWVRKGERPDKKTLALHDEDLKVYHQLFDTLTLEDGILYYRVKLNSLGNKEAWRVCVFVTLWNRWNLEKGTDEVLLCGNDVGPEKAGWGMCNMPG